MPYKGADQIVSTTGFGFLSDFAQLYKWAGQVWQGGYAGLYPYPMMLIFAPLALLPVDVAGVLWLVTLLAVLVVTLRRQSLYWIFYVPVLQLIYLGQVDLLFLPAFLSKRPAAWALLSLKPQLLPLALPVVFSSKRNALEFFGALFALQIPFLLLRPAWPLEWVRFISSYQENRITDPAATASGSLILSLWVVPLGTLLLVLLLLRRKNLAGILFLANPFLLPYDYCLLAGTVSRVSIPLSWLALWVSARAQAGWPYAVMLLATLIFETLRENPAVLGRGPVIPPGEDDL